MPVPKFLSYGEVMVQLFKGSLRGLCFLGINYLGDRWNFREHSCKTELPMMSFGLMWSQASKWGGLMDVDNPKEI